ncbi:MAG: hypothetical protein ABI876_08615 [Bacteroidota bacterium]
MEESLQHNSNRMLELVLKAFQDEYQSHKERARTIDAKAQICLTASGVFIGALFSFVSGHYENNGLVRFKYLLLVAIASLIISAILALTALMTRRTKIPPSSSELYDIVAGMLDASKGYEPDKYLITYIKDQQKVYLNANRRMSEVANSKAGYLSGSQLFLLIAIVTVATLALFIIGCL